MARRGAAGGGRAYGCARCADKPYRVWWRGCEGVLSPGAPRRGSGSQSRAHLTLERCAGERADIDDDESDETAQGRGALWPRTA